MGREPDYGLETLDRMIEMGIGAQAVCNTCEAYREVDLVALREIKGGDYSLWNRRCKCRLTEGCPGWNRFKHNRQMGFFGKLYDEDYAWERWR